MRFKQYSIVFVLLAILGCEEQSAKQEKDRTGTYINQVKDEFAPDKRVALFSVEAEKNKEDYILRGETNMPAALNALKQKLDSANIEYKDSVSVLPAKNLEEVIYGLIDISVANLRGEGKHSAELVTQTTLGTPVKIWKRTEEWYYIQTPDGYLSWVDHGGITTMKKNQFKAWKASEKVIYTQPFGQSYNQPSLDADPVTDLVTGAILELKAENANFYEVGYPDGKTAFIAKDEAKIYSEWLANLEISEESLVKTSKKLMGLPYLWGGTSSKGVDCSGFTKTIYFMNGMVIPRDASQQMKAGKTVDSTKNFENLIPGDLLFFGSPATDTTSERIVHVGMWLGHNEFIHSSGDVHISSMEEKAENFDAFNKNRYIRTKRYLNENGDELKYLKRQKIYSDSVFN